MKDIISNRLNAISDLSQRRLLREVLLDVHERMVDYNMRQYQLLEERLYNEIENPMDNLAVYSALCFKKDLDPISEFLHPMVYEDAASVFDISGSEPVIMRAFLCMSTAEIKKLVSRNETYKAILTTDQSRYEIGVKAKCCTRYVNEIEKLYRAFQQNNIPWNTINCPYAYKFIDLIPAAPVTLAEGENVIEVQVDLGGYDRYREKTDIAIPLWNICQVKAEDKTFPMPAKDRINYEHTISLMELGPQNGYLLAYGNPDYLYTKRLERELVIISGEDHQQSWALLKVENISNLRRNPSAYEMVTNKRELGFAGRYASLKSVVVRTKGELARLLQSYEQAKSVEFQTVEILDKYPKEPYTVECNAFIDDNIRVDAYKKVMLLRFTVSGGDAFTAYDKISFFVSEIQMLFPEYNCVGEIAE